MDDKEVVDIVAATNSDGVIDDAAGIDGHINADGTQASSYETDTDDDGTTSDDGSDVYGILGSDDVSIAGDSETLAVSHFIHRPLETPDTQIRLLWLHPADPKDEISCTVSTWTLGESPQFRAISYTWGSPKPEASIRLWPSADSRSAKLHAFKVRENARYALWQVRRRCPGSFVWIDSVCIDQGNLEEKGAQVAIMSSIYSNAHEVFACIGPADQSSDAIKEACRDLDGTIQDVPDDDDSYSVYKNSWNPPKGEPALLEFVDHWDTFSNRQYSHRVWIVQELYSGLKCLTLLCGNYTLSWRCLLELQWRLEYWFNQFSEGVTSREYCSDVISDLHRLFTPLSDYPATEDFRRRLMGLRSLECDNFRDRVYGILGLFDWERLGLERPVPNYDISLFDLALSLLPLTGNVEIFLANVIAEAIGFPYLGEEERFKLLEESRSHWMGRATPRTNSWYTSIYGLCLVQQDSHGRLSLDLKQRTQMQDLHLRDLELLQTSPRTIGDLPLPFSGGPRPVELYTGDEVSVLAWPQVRHGDIILHTAFFDVVLRRSDVEAQFYVIGKALFLNGYRLKNFQDWTCDCWSQELNSFKSERVHVALSGVSSVDVLVYSALDNSWNPSDQAQQLSLDFPPLGSVMRNHASTRRSDQLIRPLETSCTVHDAGQCNRWRHNELEFAIASGCGGRVQFDR